MFYPLPGGVSCLQSILRGKPQAAARVCGSDRYPNIHGTVLFYQIPYGVFVLSDVYGLPCSCEACAEPTFAFHIHSGRRCTGSADDPFADVLTHYNPHDCPHPYHAGDLPPLFGNRRGHAFSAFLTDRFSVEEVIGRTVVLHANRDDFTTQPAGDAGEKIACGQIKHIE